MVTNNSADIPTGASGTVLQGQGPNNALALSTATYPATATGTGTILRADGTNWSATTATYPNTVTSNTLLWSSDGTAISSLATANNGTLITSAGGVPSISSTLPTAVQGNITSTGTITSGTWNGTVVDVPHGGTNIATTTAYGIICGGTTATGSFQNAGTGAATSTVLIGNGNAALPSFSATPRVTALGIGATAGASGLTFDGSNLMNNYVVGTYTPTLIGGSVTGSTTYSTQVGYYVRIGAMVQIQATLVGTAATGTGNAQFGALPFTVKAQTSGNVPGSCYDQNNATWTFPASTTSLAFFGNQNTTFGNIYCSGSGTVGGVMQMFNAAFAFVYNLTHQI